MAKHDSKRLQGVEIAQAMLTSGFSQARVIQAMEGNQLPSNIDVLVLKEALDRQVQEMKGGGTEHQEEMLWNQAVTLQQLFVRLVEHATNQTHADHYDRLFRLALRAQNQSRSTLQALADLRSPKSHVFAKQANVANNQQINHAASSEPSSSEKSQNEQNELLGDGSNEQRLDTRTTSSTGTGDPAMETVGAFHRPEDS